MAMRQGIGAHSILTRRRLRLRGSEKAYGAGAGGADEEAALTPVMSISQAPPELALVPSRTPPAAVQRAIKEVLPRVQATLVIMFQFVDVAVFEHALSKR